MQEQDSLIYGLLSLGSQARESRRPLTVRTDNKGAGTGYSDHKAILDDITPFRNDNGEIQGVKVRFIKLHAGEPLFPFVAERNLEGEYDPDARIIRGVDFGWGKPELPQSRLAEIVESASPVFVRRSHLYYTSQHGTDERI